jgi:putative hydrolase of the HAD superfamily
MAEITTIFFDIGGVILSNAWDTPARRRAVEHFGLEEHEFQTRHEMLKTAFETGRMTLDDYIRKTVFHRSRSFSTEEFREFMFAQSTLMPATLGLVERLARQGRYRLFTLNNESRELHEYRVKAFGLDKYFQAFLTSCYLGLAKPDEDIFLAALGITHCDRERALFIDDRALNVEPALALGLNAILFRDLDLLREELAARGVMCE